MRCARRQLVPLLVAFRFPQHGLFVNYTAFGGCILAGAIFDSPGYALAWAGGASIGGTIGASAGFGFGVVDVYEQEVWAMKNASLISVVIAVVAVLVGALVALAHLGHVGFAVLIIVIGCASGIYSGLYVRRRRAIHRR